MRITLQTSDAGKEKLKVRVAKPLHIPDASTHRKSGIFELFKSLLSY